MRTALRKRLKIKELGLKSRGFSLVELLVVISIIAILSTVGFTTYTQAQVVARDSRRKEDLKAIQGALESYYQVNRTYPQSGGGWWYSNRSQPWISGLDFHYIDNVPTDPKSNGGDPTKDNSFGYAYWADACGSYAAGQFYILAAQLENHNDTTNLNHLDVSYCDGKGLHSTYSYSGYAYVITSQQ